MARKTASRLTKRREVEAAATREEAPETTTTKKPKKAATRAPSRKKVKAAERKRLIWGVFSGTLKEEARYPYDQRAEAEARLELLKSKGKKSYFLQPIKEIITDTPVAPPSPEELRKATAAEAIDEEEVAASEEE